MSQWHRLGRTPEHSAGIARYLDTANALYIWCDGTRNLQEWRWNFQVARRWIKEHYWRIRVNVKDYAQARCILDELGAAGLFSGGVRPVMIAGYSRGGAVAQCLAMIMAGVKQSVLAVGFASKRTGNRAFVRRLDAENFGFRGDVVPLLPPWYASIPTQWSGPWRWPLKAHVESGRVAAQWRHELTKEKV